MKLISIIMPTYNCGSYIAQSIESILAQTYQTWELLIVDDCSTDNTTQVIQPYLADLRIHYTLLTKNSGAAIARNTALQQAKGTYIAFLDSDDLWLPNKLSTQLKFMEEHHYDFSYTMYTHQRAHSSSVVSGPLHISRLGMYAYCWPGCLTVMYHREHIGQIQIASIRKNNDYALWLQICKQATCHLLTENLAYYNQHEGSISNTSYLALIRWHYILWHQAEGKNVFWAAWWTIINIICGIYKKIRYVQSL